MTVNKAMERFAWRLGGGKAFQPNQNDIEAYNTIAEFIEEKEKKQIIDNQLFGKLYIYLFGEFVNYYKASVFNNIPQKELHKLLDKPIRQIVEEVKDRLNFIEMEACMKEKNNLDDYTPIEYEEIAENLKAMINAAVNQYSPKHLNRV